MFMCMGSLDVRWITATYPLCFQHMGEQVQTYNSNT